MLVVVLVITVVKVVVEVILVEVVVVPCDIYNITKSTDASK